MQKQDVLTRLKLNRDLPNFGDLIRDSVREIEDVREARDRMKLALRAVPEALIHQLILEECKDKNLPFTIFESKRDATPKSIWRPRRPPRAKQLRLMKEKARIVADREAELLKPTAKPKRRQSNKS